MRSYTQTTGTWLRGHLQNDYGVDIYRVKWVNFEDAHVLEYRDPPFVERAGDDKTLLKMVQDGELDAGIFGAELPADPRLKSMIEDPDAETAALARQARRGAAQPYGVRDRKPVALEARAGPRGLPDAQAAKQAAGMPKPGEIDFHPFGVEACRPALEMIIDYAVQQKLIPRPFEVDELFDDTTRALD